MSRLRRPMLYITRREYGRERSWWLRLPNGPGRPLSYVFPDRVWGGKALALAVAKLIRDRFVSASPRQPYTPKGYQVGPYPHAKGIHFGVRVKGGRPYTSWVASWMEEEGQRKKHFTIGHMRSPGKAKRLAKEWRQRMITRPP